MSLSELAKQNLFKNAKDNTSLKTWNVFTNKVILKDLYLTVQ